jgi:hypothetical protein
MSTTQNVTSECCPPFDSIPWDEKTHEWKEKLFICDSIPQFLHIPLPSSMGKAIGRMNAKAQKAGALVEKDEFILLSYDPSPWKSILYMSVTKEVPDADNIKLTGTFISKVYDGPYSAVPRYIKDTVNYVSSLGKTVKKFYFYYTTCPKCAKKYGHNYIVSLAEV